MLKNKVMGPISALKQAAMMPVKVSQAKSRGCRSDSEKPGLPSSSQAPSQDSRILPVAMQAEINQESPTSMPARNAPMNTPGQ